MMKNKIASGLCATGLGIASIGMMGLSSEKVPVMWMVMCLEFQFARRDPAYIKLYIF